MTNYIWLPSVILFDLLILPRVLPIFGLPISLLFVAYCISKYGVSKEKLLAFYSIFFIGILSSICGYFIKENYFSDDIKRVAQFSCLLSYGLLNLKSIQINVKSLIYPFRFFYLWILVLGLTFFINPEFYTNISQFLYPETSYSAEENLATFRFSYFFTDPNAAGYFICFVTYTYFRLENKLAFLVFAFLIGIFIVALTQSRGAYICYLVFFTDYLITARPKPRLKFNFMSVLLLVVIAFWWLVGDSVSTFNEFYQRRLEAEEALGEGLGGGRIGKYEYFINNLNIYPIGVGYSLLRDNYEFKPHSDLIRINLAYGIPFIVFLCYFIIPRSRIYIGYFLIFLIPFLINTVIDEYKLLPFYLFSLGLLYRIDMVSNESQIYKL